MTKLKCALPSRGEMVLTKGYKNVTVNNMVVPRKSIPYQYYVVSNTTGTALTIAIVRKDATNLNASWKYQSLDFIKLYPCMFSPKFLGSISLVNDIYKLGRYTFPRMFRIVCEVTILHFCNFIKYCNQLQVATIIVVIVLSKQL